MDNTLVHAVKGLSVDDSAVDLTMMSGQAFGLGIVAVGGDGVGNGDADMAEAAAQGAAGAPPPPPGPPPNGAMPSIEEMYLRLQSVEGMFGSVRDQLAQQQQRNDALEARAAAAEALVAANAGRANTGNVAYQPQAEGHKASLSKLVKDNNANTIFSGGIGRDLDADAGTVYARCELLGVNPEAVKFNKHGLLGLPYFTGEAKNAIERQPTDGPLFDAPGDTCTLKEAMEYIKDALLKDSRLSKIHWSLLRDRHYMQPRPSDTNGAYAVRARAVAITKRCIINDPPAAETLACNSVFMATQEARGTSRVTPNNMQAGELLDQLCADLQDKTQVPEQFWTTLHIFMRNEFKLSAFPKEPMSLYKQQQAALRESRKGITADTGDTTPSAGDYIGAVTGDRGARKEPYAERKRREKQREQDAKRDADRARERARERERADRKRKADEYQRRRDSDRSRERSERDRDQRRQRSPSREHKAERGLEHEREMREMKEQMEGMSKLLAQLVKSKK